MAKDLTGRVGDVQIRVFRDAEDGFFRYELRPPAPQTRWRFEQPLDGRITGYRRAASATAALHAIHAELETKLEKTGPPHRKRSSSSRPAA